MNKYMKISIICFIALQLSFSIYLYILTVLLVQDNLKLTEHVNKLTIQTCENITSINLTDLCEVK